MSQFLTLYTTPVIYIYLSRFSHLRWFWRSRAGPEIVVPAAVPALAASPREIRQAPPPPKRREQAAKRR